MVGGCREHAQRCQMLNPNKDAIQSNTASEFSITPEYGPGVWGNCR